MGYIYNCDDIQMHCTYKYGNKTRTVMNIVGWDIYYKDDNGHIHKCDYSTFKNWIKTGKNKKYFHK